MTTTTRATQMTGAGVLVALLVFVTGPGNPSTPLIQRIIPDEPTASIRAQELAITGEEFQAGLQLIVTNPGGQSFELRGKDIVRPRESDFTVFIALPTGGIYSFIVINPDGGMSEPYALEVASNPHVIQPIIDRILPDEIRSSPLAQDLTIRGRNFEPGLRVAVTDPVGVQVLDARVRDLTRVSFVLNVALVLPGPYELVVTNADGGQSDVAAFLVR